MFDRRWMAMVVVAVVLTARAVGADEPAAPAGPEPVARSIAEIHAMPTEQIAAGVEARFRGVVTTVQYAGRLLTVQETGSATWVDVPPDLAQPSLVPNAEIEVEGTAQRSMFAPVVRPHRIVVVGHGPLPEPTPADFARLSRGFDDARPLDVAKRMVKHAATDLRNSVWALRTALAAARSFTQSLRELVDHLNVDRGSQETPGHVGLQFAGEAFPLPRFVAGNLLLVVQEAVRNALHHAEAAAIDVTVRFDAAGREVEVGVRDDGRGFEWGRQRGPAQGHFGLQGMKEDYNCYWSDAGPPDFNGRSLAEWQKAGRDLHSIVADPRFVNPREYDFRLQPDSPALALGFVPIEIEGAGLSGPMTGGACRGASPRGLRSGPPRLRRRRRSSTPPKTSTSANPLEVAGKEGAAEAVVTDREPATIGLELRDWAGLSQSGDRYLTGPSLRFNPDGSVQAAGPGAAGWMTVGRYDLGRWLRVEVEFEEGDAKPKTYALRLTGPDGATTAKEGLPFLQPEFQVCTWCGFVGIDAKPAVFYVDDIRLE